MTVTYILQYKYDTIGDGEWIDEFQSETFAGMRERMLNHIQDFETMKCRMIKREYSVKEEEIGTYVPPEAFREEA